CTPARATQRKRLAADPSLARPQRLGALFLAPYSGERDARVYACARPRGLGPPTSGKCASNFRDRRRVENNSKAHGFSPVASRAAQGAGSRARLLPRLFFAHAV